MRKDEGKFAIRYFLTAKHRPHARGREPQKISGQGRHRVPPARAREYVSDPKFVHFRPLKAWYRPHAREDARGCRAVAFVILTHGAGCPGGMAATMRAAGFCRIYPPMSVCPGEVFDAGGAPLCDMDADVERGVVPCDDKYILRPVRLPVRMRCWGPSFRFLYGGLKVRWRKF